MFRDETQANIIDLGEEYEENDQTEVVKKSSNKKKITDDSYDEDIEAIQLVNKFEYSNNNQFIPMKTSSATATNNAPVKKDLDMAEDFKKPLITPLVQSKPSVEHKFEVPKPPVQVIQPQDSIMFGADDDVDDEEFNKWLVEDTLMENSTSAVDTSVAFNAKIENNLTMNSSKQVLDSSTIGNQCKLDPKNITHLIKVDKSSIKVENPLQIVSKPEVYCLLLILVSKLKLYFKILRIIFNFIFKVKLEKCPNRIIVDNSLLASSQVSLNVDFKPYLNLFGLLYKG